MNNKIRLLALILISFCFIFGFSLNQTPQQIIITDIKTKTAVNNIIKFVEENNYEKAMENFEKIHQDSDILIKQNYDVFNKLLSNYKKILINQASKLIDSNEYAKASVLLNSKIKFYENDESVRNILNTTENKLNKHNTSAYEGDVAVLYFKNILAYPNVALNTKNINYSELDAHHITPTEFKKILHYLYTQNFVLINYKDLYTQNKTQITQLLPNLPNGKKPVILILDHTTYPNNPGSLADKTIIDRNRKLATYTSKKSIHERVSYNKEFTTILENFISTNPFFSYKNSRPIICFNGTDGVLGYKTYQNNLAFKSEVKKVKRVIQKLKSLGYNFASSGYSKTNINQQTNSEFLDDVLKWKKEVESITQKTPVYNIKTSTEHSLKGFGEHIKILVDNGFSVLLAEHNNDNNKLKVVDLQNNDFLLIPYHKITGDSLRDKNSYIYSLLNKTDIYDNEFRINPIMFN